MLMYKRLPVASTNPFLALPVASTNTFLAQVQHTLIIWGGASPYMFNDCQLQCPCMASVTSSRSGRSFDPSHVFCTRTTARSITKAEKCLLNSQFPVTWTIWPFVRWSLRMHTSKYLQRWWIDVFSVQVKFYACCEETSHPGFALTTTK